MGHFMGYYSPVSSLPWLENPPEMHFDDVNSPEISISSSGFFCVFFFIAMFDYWWSTSPLEFDRMSPNSMEVHSWEDHRQGDFPMPSWKNPDGLLRFFFFSGVFSTGKSTKHVESCFGMFWEDVLTLAESHPWWVKGVIFRDFIDFGPGSRFLMREEGLESMQWQLWPHDNIWRFPENDTMG